MPVNVYMIFDFRTSKWVTYTFVGAGTNYKTYIIRLNKRSVGESSVTRFIVTVMIHFAMSRKSVVIAVGL